jgi:uncharacterized protein
MDSAALATLSSPVILFFILGLVAAFLRSELTIPEAVAKGLSIYLMIAIGLKGGVAVAKTGFSGEMLAVLAVGITASFAFPLLAFAALRGFGRAGVVDAGAIAAHYGSVSVVTFVTANEILTASGLAPAGYLVAVLAAMETPAILSGLLLARRALPRSVEASQGGELWREVFLNGSVVLLVGSFAIGLIAGPERYTEVQPLFEGLFKWALCLFLLDMGLMAARRLVETRALTARLALLAIALPVINGTIGLAAAVALGLGAGTAAGFAVLCASASYIAVPAAMRMALPQANPGLYLAMSLSITFPFNILFGIGLFAWAAARLTGA